MGRPISWTEDQVAKLNLLKSKGVPTAEIAEIMGRTIKAIKAKIAFLNLSPEAKARRAETDKNRLRRGIRIRQPDGTLPRAPICAAVLADRNLRINTPPRDLTAAFFNDPLPGYSALERRA
ncbi:MAG: hypothetical protein JWP25_4714 [Bradyrhizobium sp.]|nr:hypothetical protein [Bradyrhizobium sp.]